MEAGVPDLPVKISHPAHKYPDHTSQVLRRYSIHEFISRRSCCSICRNYFKEGDYIYVCQWRGIIDDPDFNCDFTVDIACSSIKAAVDFRSHGHPLFFLKRFDPSRPQNCESCQGGANELMFRCIKAGGHYNLHLSCGPLPVAIRYHHSGHALTLTLMDSLLDGADPEDSWCDICEERRDPWKCVYRSEDPPFTATIDCLLPQIVGALQGYHGDVALRTVRGHVPGNVVVMTAQESTKQGSGEEKSVLHGDAEEVLMGRKIEINAADVEDNVDFTVHDEILYDLVPQEDRELIECALTETEKGWTTEGKDMDKDAMPFKFSDEAFEQFKEHDIAITGAIYLSRLRLMSAYWLDEKPRFVKVGSNSVYPELAPLYHQLIDKHGDFTAGCPLSPMGKAALLTLLLMLIQCTQGLQICEITGDLLVTLQLYLKTLDGKLGFNVQFALDNLEELAHACYALKFIKARDNITADLTQKIEQLERDIPEDKPKIEALKEQHRRGKESVFVKQCWAEASASKWKNAGEFLGLDLEE